MAMRRKFASDKEMEMDVYVQVDVVREGQGQNRDRRASFEIRLLFQDTLNSLDPEIKSQ